MVLVVVVELVVVVVVFVGEEKVVVGEQGLNWGTAGKGLLGFILQCP